MTITGTKELPGPESNAPNIGRIRAAATAVTTTTGNAE